MSNNSIRQNKLTPKDISESLGKLPPQAIDMEEAVLGAILIEKDAITHVDKFLLPNHFYSDVHAEIYIAVLDLIASSQPVDIRTVRNYLAKVGKIELIGGAFYLAELTTKVSGSANIEAHARVIVEMAVKRTLIQIASSIHQRAYLDTTDCFDLLDSTLNDLETFKQTTTLENSEDRIKALWQETMVTVEPADNPPLIMIDDSPIATAGNHSLIVGKKKSRKTLYVIWLISKYLKYSPDKNNSVLIFDTEQGRKHVFKLRSKLHLMTGSLVPVFYLRGQSPKERRDFIAQTVEHWPDRPTLIIIDGIRDLMSNINDPDETTEVIVWLEKLTLKYNVHVSNVLHLNKTDGNARGHIGSELLNKAEITMELERDEKTNTTVVKCESSREKPFESFAFTHGDNDLPVLVGVPLAEGALPDAEKLNRLVTVFEEGALKYSDVIDQIKINFAVGVNKAGHLLAEFQRNSWVVRSGPARNQNTTYKLALTITKPTIEPSIPRVAVPEDNQTDLPF